MATRLKVISLVCEVGRLTKLSVGREKVPVRFICTFLQHCRWQLGTIINQTGSFCDFFTLCCCSLFQVQPLSESCHLTMLNVIFALSSLPPDLPKVKWHQVYQLQKCQRPDIHVCHVRAVCPPTRWTPAQQGFLHPRSGLYAEVRKCASQTFNPFSFRFHVLWHSSRFVLIHALSTSCFTNRRLTVCDHKALQSIPRGGLIHQSAVWHDDGTEWYAAGLWCQEFTLSFFSQVHKQW